MHHGWAVGIIIPARNEAEHIAEVIRNIPLWVDAIICVDDASTDGTKEIAMKVSSGKSENGWNGLFRCISNSNLGVADGGGIRTGVGASIDNGQKELLNLAINGQWAKGKPWLSVVMDGDGQMASRDLAKIVEPIIKDNAEMVKGNRKLGPNGFGKMPLRRRLGTFFLKHLTNLASGRELSDPQCGFVALSHTAIKEWDFTNQWDGYGYPNHRILMASLNLWRVVEVPVSSVYEGQKSGIRILRFLPKVAGLLWSGLMIRGGNWYLGRTIESPSVESVEGSAESKKALEGKRVSLVKTPVLYFYLGWYDLAIGLFFLLRGMYYISLSFWTVSIATFWFSRHLDKKFLRQKLIRRHAQQAIIIGKIETKD